MDTMNNIPVDQMLLIQEEPRGASMLIETLVTPGQTIVTLPVVQELTSDTTQRVIIKAIRLITVAELTIAPVAGNPNAPLTELQKIVFQMYSQGWLKGNNVPLLGFNNTFTEGTGIPWRDKTTRLQNWTNFDWNKSKFVFANGTVSVAPQYNIILDVEYIRFDQNGKEIKGTSVS